MTIDETTAIARAPRRPRLGVAHALAAVALAAVLLPPTSSADLVTSPPSDPLGDVAAGPDVTQVAVLDTTAGPVHFAVTVANEPVLQSGSVLELRFDVDMNPSTGSNTGSERLISRLWTGATRLCTWAGSFFSCTSSPTTTSTYVDGFWSVTTTAAALGVGAPGFDYSVAGYNAPNVDFAPDSGTWRYPMGAASWACDPVLPCSAVGSVRSPLPPARPSRPT